MKKSASVRWPGSTATDKSVTGDSGVGSCDLLFKHLWAVDAVEFQQIDAKPTEHTVVECNGIEVRDIEFNIA